MTANVYRNQGQKRMLVTIVGFVRAESEKRKAESEKRKAVEFFY